MSQVFSESEAGEIAMLKGQLRQADAEAKRIGTATLFPGNAKKNLPQDWSKEKHQTMPLHCAKGGR